jgi:hypothetical protein
MIHATGKAGHQLVFGCKFYRYWKWVMYAGQVSG